MEISVGFADKNRDYATEGYDRAESDLGIVYIPQEGIDITGPIRIRYERHPWIECFEVDGIVPKRPVRRGYGAKGFRAFVTSLNTIYLQAYADFEQCSTPADYFAHVTATFIDKFGDDEHSKIFRKFCGFTENLWREGDKEMYDVAMNTILPMFHRDEKLWKNFTDSITDEFLNYIQGVQDGKKEKF